MVGHPEISPRKEWNLDADGISWVAIPKDLKAEGCVERNGQIMYPMQADTAIRGNYN